MNKFWSAVAILVSSTVGIGFLGMPYTFAKAGIGMGLVFLVAITFLFLILNLVYGEVILRTHYRHQFVGFVGTYLGGIPKIINLLNFILSIFGATIGVLIVNGQFMSRILNTLSVSVSPVILSTIFFILSLIVVYFGLKIVAKADLIMLLLIFAAIAIISIRGLSFINFANFEFASGTNWFLPFGVILFALSGTQGVPLAREILVGDERLFKKAIIVGTLLPALIYGIFSVIVVGVSGLETADNAIYGLSNFLGIKIIVLGSILGLISSTSIFINMITAFKTSLREDLRLKRRWDFFIPMLIPFALFLMGARNLVAVIGFVGGLAVGIDMILLLFVYAKARNMGSRVPEYTVKIPKYLLYIIMLIFACGAILTILS